MINHKVCTVCKMDKPLPDFPPNSRTSTGRQSYCRACKLEYRQNKIREKGGMTRKEYRIAALNRLSKRCAGCKTIKSLTEFPTRKDSLDGRYCRCKVCSNKSHSHCSVKRNYHLQNGDVTTAELIEIFIRDKGNCVYCGIRIKNPVFNPKNPKGYDHVIPFAKGGKHTAQNIAVCCKRCNELKGVNSSP